MNNKMRRIAVTIALGGVMLFTAIGGASAAGSSSDKDSGIVVIVKPKIVKKKIATTIIVEPSLKPVDITSIEKKLSPVRPEQPVQKQLSLSILIP